MARKLSADDAESIRLARQLQEDDDRILAQELQSSYQAGIFSPERVTIPDDDDEDDDDEPMIVDERPRVCRHNAIYNTVPLHHLSMSHSEISTDMSPDTAELIMHAFNTSGVWNTTEDSDDEDGIFILNNIEDDNNNERSEHSNQITYSPQLSSLRMNQPRSEIGVISLDEMSSVTADDNQIDTEAPPHPVLRSHTRATVQTSNQPTAHVINRGNQRTARTRSEEAARTVLTVGQRTQNTDISTEQSADSSSSDTRGRSSARVAQRRDGEGSVSMPQGSSRGSGGRVTQRRDGEGSVSLPQGSSRGRGGRGRQRRRNHSGRRNDTAHRTIYQGTPLVPDPHMLGTHILQPLHLMMGSDFHMPNFQFLDHSLSYEEMAALDEDNLAPGQGVDKTTIERNSLVKKFQKSEDTSCSACNICLTDFEDGEVLRTLPCFHIFHSECIDNWLSRSPICPVCRTNINKSEDS